MKLRAPAHCGPLWYNGKKVGPGDKLEVEARDCAALLAEGWEEVKPPKPKPKKTKKTEVAED